MNTFTESVLGIDDNIKMTEDEIVFNNVSHRLCLKCHSIATSSYDTDAFGRELKIGDWVLCRDCLIFRIGRVKSMNKNKKYIYVEVPYKTKSSGSHEVTYRPADVIRIDNKQEYINMI